MDRFIKWVFYILFSAAGISIGWRIFSLTQPMFDQLPMEIQRINSVAFIGLGLLSGVSIASLASNQMLKYLDRSIQYLQKTPPLQILGGSLGLIFALIVSALFTVLLGTVPFGNIPLGGDYVFPVIVLFTSLFLCYIGLYFGTRLTSNNAAIPVPKGDLSQGIDFLWGRSYKILDTSVIIDGRISDIMKTGFLEGSIVIPRFVLKELQTISDSADDLKRAKGRRGLDMLNNLRKDFGIQIMEKNYTDPEVDAKLLALAQEIKGTIMTTDYNLGKLAALQGITVLNINELANAVKPAMLPGEVVKVRVVKEGKENNQGIAYLDSGTMIVIENGKQSIGKEIVVEVTGVIQTMAGKMIFAKHI